MATPAWWTGGRASPATGRVPLELVEEVLRLYREVYFDPNIRHFHEKLQEEHGIHLSYTWVQKALQGAGLVAHGRRRRNIGGEENGGPCWYDLIVILDDATSEIYYAQLVEEESTRTVLAGLREVIERSGCSAHCTATGQVMCE